MERNQVFTLVTLYDGILNEIFSLIVRELVARNEDGVACRPLHHYQLTFITADVRGAGTDADITAVLYGEHGDTGDKKVLFLFMSVVSLCSFIVFVVV